MHQDIGEQKNELKLQSSAIIELQKQEYEQEVVESKVVEGQLDPEEIENWLNQNNSSSETSQESDSDEDFHETRKSGLMVLGRSKMSEISGGFAIGKTSEREGPSERKTE